MNIKAPDNHLQSQRTLINSQLNEMPLWRIFAHPSTYTVQDKDAISKAITSIYTRPDLGLPAFYVVVIFVPVEEGNLFVGGKARKDFVRISVEHIARTIESTEQKKATMEAFNQVCTCSLSFGGYLTSGVSYFF
jgi:phenylpyruvate tautomerase PptA (4-oxalocrotonate tautomerase family)